MDGNGYVCLKPLTLSGADYLPGNRIPADAVLPNRVRALEKMGYIAECDAEEQAGYIPEEAPKAVFMVPISPVSGDGEHLDGIPAKEADVAAMALVLMLTAENASETIREMENETAHILRGRRSGRQYKVPHTGVAYRASAPGEAPAARTGTLRNSWGIIAMGSVALGRYSSGIQTNVPYAPMLEDGTSRMAARPFREKIIRRASPRIGDIFRSAGFR